MITALYAGILGIFLFVLNFIVIRNRFKHGVGLGVGDPKKDIALQRIVRVHGNFIEMVPIALILMALAEMSGQYPTWIFHTMGIVLVIARVMHAYGLGHNAGTSLGRLIGTAASQLVILAGAVMCLWFGYATI